MLANKATLKMMVKELNIVYQTLLENEETVLIHCAAGIHRTGVVAYTLLRMDGKDKKEAYDTLKDMREATHRGVGDWRIKIAEDHLVP